MSYNKSLSQPIKTKRRSERESKSQDPRPKALEEAAEMMDQSQDSEESKNVKCILTNNEIHKQ
jgi:hypothetical protein